jgi:hypothetical protein
VTGFADRCGQFRTRTITAELHTASLRGGQCDLRQRNWRRNKRLGLRVRPVRLSVKEAQKLVELGYLSLDSKGDKRAEAIAIEAYLGDSLS